MTTSNYRKRNGKETELPRTEQLTMVDVPCERKVIATLMTQNWAFSQVTDRIAVDLFTDPLCHQCMRAILQLVAKKVPLDFIAVNAEVSTFCDTIPVYEIVALSQEMLGTPEQLSNYVGRLHDLLTRRKFFYLGTTLREMGTSETKELDDCLAYLRKETDEILGSGLPAGTSTLTDGLVQLEDFLCKRQDGLIDNFGSLTGFDQLDEGGGFLPGQLIVIGAGTSQGKTSLALSLVDHIIRQHIRIGFFSLEMTQRDLTARYVAMQCGISSGKQLHPSQQLSVDDFNTVASAIGAVGDTGDQLFFDDNFTADINSICASIRCMVYRHHIRGVVVDYLQILNTNQSVTNREQFMGDVARMLKKLALELDIWILALSQLNRDNEMLEPTLNRLRDSGQIAEAADVVLLLYRPEHYMRPYSAPFETVSTHHTALLHVAKNRNGQTARTIIGFTPERTLFQPLPPGAWPRAKVPAAMDKNKFSSNQF